MASEFQELRDMILDMKTDIISAIQAATIKNEHASAVQWIKKHIKTNGYITWAKVKDHPEFQELVKYNHKFHRIMRTYMPVLDWQVRTVEGVTFYYAEGFDIDGVIKNLGWQNFKPRDRKFLDMLIKEVITKAAGERVNVYKWLEAEYPQKSLQWCTDATDALQDRVRDYYKGKVKFDGDDFWIVT